MAEAPRVSVIVPAYHAGSTIDACLDSLLRQSDAPAYEIVVVDSSGDAATEAAVAAGAAAARAVGSCVACRLVRLASRAFPGVARNVGVEASAGGILLFVDADCVADPSLVAMAARLVAAGTPVVGGAIAFAPTGRASARLRHLLEFKESLPTVPRRSTWTLASACLAVCRSVFDRAGGFPAVRASEDWLLDWQLWRAGVPMHFDPRLRVQHRTAAGWRALARYSHLLGQWSGQARKSSDLPGQLVVRHPGLCIFLPIGRLGRALAWCARHDRREFGFLALWSPAYLAMAAIWATGFYRGVRGGTADLAAS